MDNIWHECRLTTQGQGDYDVTKIKNQFSKQANEFLVVTFSFLHCGAILFNLITNH